MTQKTKIRKRAAVYRLLVDPERVVPGDNIHGWILDILIAAGGRMSREDMVRKFTTMLRRKRPQIAVRPSSVLSKHQRYLQDQNVLQIVDAAGKPVAPRKRVSLLRRK